MPDGKVPEGTEKLDDEVIDANFTEAKPEQDKK
jgi:hypothetical protein